MANCKHIWKYAAGRAWCEKCGQYLQPDGKITKTPTGRGVGGKKQ